MKALAQKEVISTWSEGGSKSPLVSAFVFLNSVLVWLVFQ
uniref:Uncharacterized protein n=1 Tax=Rhizophora mucronata TaxID=61149 RepID=A0A2P2QTR6_RHIMU